MATEAAKFTFVPVHEDLPALKAKETKETLAKWLVIPMVFPPWLTWRGLLDTLRTYRFRFDQPVNALELEKFLKVKNMGIFEKFIS
jgi:hypothetical protein